MTKGAQTEGQLCPQLTANPDPDEAVGRPTTLENTLFSSPRKEKSQTGKVPKFPVPIPPRKK